MLIALKVPVTAAHLSVFHLRIIADLTPPVTLGAMASGGGSPGEFHENRYHGDHDGHGHILSWHDPFPKMSDAMMVQNNLSNRLP